MEAAPRGALKPAWLVWLVLSMILAGYAASIVRLHPTNFFGATEDDSIYFSSAKALAEGRGYILPSVPGTPPATKYPILYPLILSAVWKLNPSFPANLPWAIAVTVVFGFVYIVAGFVFLRRLQVLHDAEVLLLTAFCAFHPVVLFYSASVLSDVPFAALALVAMLLADSMLEPNARARLAALCGIVTGLSLMMRMFGLAIVAGILLAAVVCRAWKQLSTFSAGLAPFLFIIVWRSVHRTVTVPPVSAEWVNSPGWINAWAYYTSYLGFWKLSVPNLHLFVVMVENNLHLLVQAPADLFLAPSLVRDTLIGRAAVLLVTVIIVVGVLRQARQCGFKPWHFALLFYSSLIILWNFPDASNRFFLPFYFLLVAGLWIESRRVVSLLRLKVFTGTLAERFLAAAFGAAILFAGAGIVFNYRGGHRRDIQGLSTHRGATLKAKRQAYRWLAEHGCCSPVLAYEDVDVYLYSGREAMRPIVFVTSSIYQPTILDQSLNELMDVGRALKAGYWLFSDDDFALESEHARTAVRNCLSGAGPNDWRESFKSNDGPVVLRKFPNATGHDLSCEREIH
jgi:4-amino-4-deoxy-L-arabinose transferase-like glycosyltransferase